MIQAMQTGAKQGQTLPSFPNFTGNGPLPQGSSFARVGKLRLLPSFPWFASFLQSPRIAEAGAFVTEARAI
jgi:hypothetical protein